MLYTNLEYFQNLWHANIEMWYVTPVAHHPVPRPAQHPALLQPLKGHLSQLMFPNKHPLKLHKNCFVIAGNQMMVPKKWLGVITKTVWTSGTIWAALHYQKPPRPNFGFAQSVRVCNRLRKRGSDFVSLLYLAYCIISLVVSNFLWSLHLVCMYIIINMWKWLLFALLWSLYICLKEWIVYSMYIVFCVVYVYCVGVIIPGRVICNFSITMYWN